MELQDIIALPADDAVLCLSSLGDDTDLYRTEQDCDINLIYFDRQYVEMWFEKTGEVYFRIISVEEVYDLYLVHLKLPG